MLTISRPNVDRYNITTFAVAERFIKLPIENYLKLLNWEGKVVYDEINRPQIALINAVNDPRFRFVVACLSRRLGKTFIANIIGQLVTLVPGFNVLIMAPNINLATISFELQRRFIRVFDLEVVADNKKDRVLELENGSTIRMGSITTVDSCVGRSYDLIIFDEAALGADAENAFNVSLRPTLDRPNSKAIFISTPRGRNNWFSKFYQRGFSDEYPEWISIHADYTENTRMSEKDVEEARRSMSRNEFEQEYMASFTIFEGQIYQLPAASVCEFEPKGYRTHLIAGLDPGYKDPTAFAVIAFVEAEDEPYFHIIDEYMESNQVTATHAARLQELIGKYLIDAVFIDSAAAQFASDLAYTYDIATIKAKKDVLPGIAYVQTLVETGKLKVSPHCTHVLTMFDQYAWDTRETLTKEKPKHDFSDIGDAIRYALYTYTL